MPTPSISVVITAYNEGEELSRTIRSVLDNTRHLVEVIIVDDGSGDASSDALPREMVRVIRHDRRIGVAYSRDVGSRAATGDVLCYLDGHQRVSKGCLDHCAKMAVERHAITCPDLKDYGLFRWRLHGADFRICPRHGYFGCVWRQWWSLGRIRQITGLRAPPYLIPRSLYDGVAWSPTLRGWGATEASMVVKSYFLGTCILQLSGPLARHRFQKQFPYKTSWDGVWRNHAIIARTCFDDATWFRYWLPQVFEPHLTLAARQTLESPEVQTEHEAFLAKKVRTDRQFWADLLRTSPPAGI